MPTFPSFDLSKLDLSKLDVTKLDLTKLDVSKLRDLDLPNVDTDKLVGLLRDAAYVVIGFGVLTVQQLQVRRRELVESLAANPVAKQLGATREQLEQLVGDLEARAEQLGQRVQVLEAKLDEAVERVEQLLPGQAGAVLGQAHDLAKAARTQVRGLLRSAA